ncbi:hypothetical protein ACWU37_21320 (plasmid) [Photobacterium damselae subsp. damselae]|uniref:hypothetical protein n=1 Tax=Photobacterium damselae TaxID=38293 RepID=UPI001F37771C|nr:hypothetical protein [Photobacterium damselae]UKA12850.1 hypothetical protein IHC91_20890 [Photobacterium damselae subsp. damselae]
MRKYDVVRLIDHPNIKIQVIDPTCLSFDSSSTSIELVMVGWPLNYPLFLDTFVKPELHEEYKNNQLELKVKVSSVELVPSDDSDLKDCHCSDLNCTARYVTILGALCSECHIGTMGE